MLDAAEQFASDEMGNKAVTEPVREEVEVVNVNHYSYWYGYPHWYGYPCLAPNSFGYLL